MWDRGKRQVKGAALASSGRPDSGRESVQLTRYCIRSSHYHLECSEYHVQDAPDPDYNLP